MHFGQCFNQSVSQFMVLGMFLVTARFIPKEDFGVMAISMLIYEFFKQLFIESVATAMISRGKLHAKSYNAGFFYR